MKRCTSTVNVPGCVCVCVKERGRGCLYERGYSWHYNKVFQNYLQKPTILAMEYVVPVAPRAKCMNQPERPFVSRHVTWIMEDVEMINGVS